MNRRQVLALLGSTTAVSVGGCLSSGDATDATGGTADGQQQGQTTPTEPATDSPGATPTGTEDATPPDIETPAPGECDARSPPRPDPAEGLPEPRAYPEPPESFDRSSVRSFLEDYESAHRFNRILKGLVADDACVSYVDAPATESVVEAVDGGFVAEVSTRGSYTGTVCEDGERTGSDTPTPLPHADLAIETAHYYVTERFLVRDGVVLACWE